LGVIIHEFARDFDEAVELFLKVGKRGKVELWRADGGSYAIVSRAGRGKAPKILLERLDAECPECGGPAVTVWKKGETRALKGHVRRNSKGEVEVVHPVFLV